jgi:hypothetical protein
LVVVFLTGVLAGVRFAFGDLGAVWTANTRAAAFSYDNGGYVKCDESNDSKQQTANSSQQARSSGQKI